MQLMTESIIKFKKNNYKQHVAHVRLYIDYDRHIIVM